MSLLTWDAVYQIWSGIYPAAWWMDPWNYLPRLGRAYHRQHLGLPLR